jgi:hypothetical protein
MALTLVGQEISSVELGEVLSLYSATAQNVPPGCSFPVPSRRRFSQMRQNMGIRASDPSMDCNLSSGCTHWVFGLEVIAPQVQELAPYVHFHTKTSKVCSGGTRTCPGCAPLVQVVSGAATRPWPTIKAFLQRSPYENRDFARD